MALCIAISILIVNRPQPASADGCAVSINGPSTIRKDGFDKYLWTIQNPCTRKALVYYFAKGRRHLIFVNPGATERHTCSLDMAHIYDCHNLTWSYEFSRYGPTAPAAPPEDVEATEEAPSEHGRIKDLIDKGVAPTLFSPDRSIRAIQKKVYKELRGRLDESEARLDAAAREIERFDSRPGEPAGGSPLPPARPAPVPRRVLPEEEDLGGVNLTVKPRGEPADLSALRKKVLELSKQPAP